MRKKYWLIVGITLICLMVFVTSELGELIGEPKTITEKDIEITYPANKDVNNTFSKTEMLDFNDIKYEIKGNTIILNKEGLFQNREIVFSEEQTCLGYTEPTCTEYSVVECLEYETRQPIECSNWESEMQEVCLEWTQPKDCIEFDSKTGVCSKYEAELACLRESEAKCLSMSERACNSWTETTRDEFIQARIKQEIEFVKGVQANRALRTQTSVEEMGKVIIK